MPYSYQDHQISCLHGGLQYHRQKRAAPIIRITAVPQFQFTPSTADGGVAACTLCHQCWQMSAKIDSQSLQKRRRLMTVKEAWAGRLASQCWGRPLHQLNRQAASRLTLAQKSACLSLDSWTKTNLSCDWKCVWNGRCLRSDFVAR